MRADRKRGPGGNKVDNLIHDIGAAALEETVDLTKQYYQTVGKYHGLI